MPHSVVVRFRSSSKVKSLPSKSLNLALTSLADSDELQPLMCQATAAGRALAFDVYQNRQGQPFLINIKQEEPMKSYDNNGKLVGELSNFRTADGKNVSVTTQYNSFNGRPVSQNITVTDTNGKVTVTNLINGKLLP